MTLKKLICALLALMMLVMSCAASLAEVVDLQEKEKQLQAAEQELAASQAVLSDQAARLQQAQAALEAQQAALDTKEQEMQAALDAANARIQELEAQIDQYYPFYEAQIVAEYGNGEIIWRQDAQAAYENEVARYQSYGYSVEGYESLLKENVVKDLVSQAVLKAKAEEFGLAELTEEDLAAIGEQADDILNQYVEAYKQYFQVEGQSDEEVVEATISYLASAGMTRDALIEQLSENHWDDALYKYVIQGVEVTDEEVRAYYDRKVAEDESAYAGNDRRYNTDRMNGEMIAWNPEGYRAVTHVLIKFSDEQANAYSTLQSTLSALQAELDQEPAEGEQPRSREEIENDIAATSDQLNALYAELLPRAEEVIGAFNAGEDFYALIDAYGEDPGMQNEPTRSEGYAVAANSTTWDSAFTEGAMSIAEKGGISGPVFGMNGIHIIYYKDDIPAGAVPFEALEEAARTQAQEQKVGEVYDAQVSTWIEEAVPVYYLDRF